MDDESLWCLLIPTCVFVQSRKKVKFTEESAMAIEMKNDKDSRGLMIANLGVLNLVLFIYLFCADLEIKVFTIII